MSDWRAAYEATPAVEWTEPDTNDGEWPPPAECARREATGPLAEAIRRRLDVTSDVPVFITETFSVGGWSEYTEEHYYDTEIVCGDVRKVFDSDDAQKNLNDLLAWLDEAAQ